MHIQQIYKTRYRALPFNAVLYQLSEPKWATKIHIQIVEHTDRSPRLFNWLAQRVLASCRGNQLSLKGPLKTMNISIALRVVVRFNLAKTGEKAIIAPSRVTDRLPPDIIVLFLTTEPSTC